MRQAILIVTLLTFSSNINCSERQNDIYDPVKLEQLMQDLLNLRELIINSFSDVKLLNEEMRKTQGYLRDLELDIRCKRRIAQLKKMSNLNGNSQGLNLTLLLQFK